MNEREVSELRRRLRPEKNNITHICGCFVNEKREVVSLFSQSLTMMPQEEAEAYLSLLKRTLSGGLGKNLIDITFTTRQVADCCGELTGTSSPPETEDAAPEDAGAGPAARSMAQPPSSSATQK